MPVVLKVVAVGKRNEDTYMLHVSEAQRQVGQGARNQDAVSANDSDNDAFDSQVPVASKLTF